MLSPDSRNTACPLSGRNSTYHPVQIREASSLQNILIHIGEKREPSIRTAFATVNAFQHTASVPQQFRAVLVNPSWANDLPTVENTIEEGKKLTTLCTDIEAQFREEAWSCDTGALLLALRADGPSFLRRLGGRYRKAKADLRAIYKGKPPRSLDERIALLERLHDGQKKRREFRDRAGALSSMLGHAWAELETPWDDLGALVIWVRGALSEIGGAHLMTLASRAPDLTVFATAADKLQVATTEARVAFDEVNDHIQCDLKAIFGTDDYRSLPISRIADRLAVWLQNLNRVNDWVEVRNALSNLRSKGLATIVDGLSDGSIRPDEVRAVTDLLISESLWHRAQTEMPEILALDGNIRTHHVLEFRDLDQQRIRAAGHEVLKAYLDRRPTGYVGAMSVIRSEINKKRRHRSVRKLMIDAGLTVQHLKPVFLMSPLSVAQFLPPGRLSFDLLVVDEASQVSPEDALGVMARAKQTIVVGDDKQLPPTNFFRMINLGDDELEDETAELKPEKPSNFESILSLSRTRGMSERMLAWHYRSKHPSLIALSNEECYAGRLLLPPSPFIQTSEFGLSFVQTPRGFYDRGNTSRDLVQAETVVKAILDHISTYPNKSLGVACLSAQQRDAVDDMIDRLGIRGPVEEFCPRGERLFVKNLEAAQGDERDVIFISIGYGVAQGESRPFLNFGPVSREGGERRLNVLASRAREKCVVFSSITAGDIPADADVRGTRMLRALLSYAETGKRGAGTVTGGDFESPFEEAVARVIRQAGFHVHPQVGVSSFRIDLGVVDPAKPGEYVLGVECDGAAYHSARSARDRDRLRQEILESRGWQLHRVWGADWFRNPQRESEKLLAAIMTAKDKTNRARVEPAQDDDVLENEDLEDTSEDAIIIPLDDPDNARAALANTEEYKECSVKAPYRRDLLDLSIADVARLALAIVEAEGPIHTEEVARRMREAFGLQKTGRKILAHVHSGLKYLSRKGSIVHDRDFWSASGREVETVRDRRGAAFSLRRAKMISPAEYQLAISTIVSQVVEISRDELVVETARVFGFDRTGSELRQAIDREVATLVKKGRLQADDGILRPSGSST